MMNAEDVIPNRKNPVMNNLEMEKLIPYEKGRGTLISSA